MDQEKIKPGMAVSAADWAGLQPAVDLGEQALNLALERSGVGKEQLGAWAWVPPYWSGERLFELIDVRASNY